MSGESWPDLRRERGSGRGRLSAVTVGPGAPRGRAVGDVAVLVAAGPFSAGRLVAWRQRCPTQGKPDALAAGRCCLRLLRGRGSLGCDAGRWWPGGVVRWWVGLALCCWTSERSHEGSPRRPEDHHTSLRSVLTLGSLPGASVSTRGRRRRTPSGRRAGRGASWDGCDGGCGGPFGTRAPRSCPVACCSCDLPQCRSDVDSETHSITAWG